MSDLREHNGWKRIASPRDDEWRFEKIIDGKRAFAIAYIGDLSPPLEHVRALLDDEEMFLREDGPPPHGPRGVSPSGTPA